MKLEDSSVSCQKRMVESFTFQVSGFMKQGFTLIEILIVVAIISILSSIVLIGLGPTQRIGRDARRLVDLRQVQTALGLYFNKCGYYPGLEQPGTPPCSEFVPISGWTSLKNSIIRSNLGVNQMPDDPSAAVGPGRNYLYGSAPDGSGYVLGATFEDVNNQALSNDIDGQVYGVNCGSPSSDTVYCIQV